MRARGTIAVVREVAARRHERGTGYNKNQEQRRGSTHGVADDAMHCHLHHGPLCDARDWPVGPGGKSDATTERPSPESRHRTTGKEGVAVVVGWDVG